MSNRPRGRFDSSAKTSVPVLSYSSKSSGSGMKALSHTTSSRSFNRVYIP